ncbi:YciI family protein [Streptomyces sp. NPDC002516]
MGYFAVTREAGPALTDGLGITGQPQLEQHAAFMDSLATAGFVLFAGPLSGIEHGRLRALLIANADNETQIRQRLADDPWSLSGHLRTVSIEPWNIFVGGERIATPSVQAPVQR